MVDQIHSGVGDNIIGDKYEYIIRSIKSKGSADCYRQYNERYLL